MDTEFKWWMLLTGPSIHLWFLPFVFLCNLLVIALLVPHRQTTNTFIFVTIALTIVGLICPAIASTVSLGPPFDQWLQVIPSAVFGLLFALARRSCAKLMVLIIVVVAVTAATMALRWVEGIPYLLVSAAISLLVILNFAPSRVVSMALGKASFGVYLIHPFVFALLSRVTNAENKDGRCLYWS